MLFKDRIFKLTFDLKLQVKLGGLDLTATVSSFKVIIEQYAIFKVEVQVQPNDTQTNTYNYYILLFLDWAYIAY